VITSKLFYYGLNFKYYVPGQVLYVCMFMATNYAKNYVGIMYTSLDVNLSNATIDDSVEKTDERHHYYKMYLKV